jgi:hypothetical protein
VSTTSVKLLKAAAEVAGGTRALAAQLGIGEKLLAIFMADQRELPDPLLLRAVDVILADRQAQFAPASRSLAFEKKPLPDAPETPS